MYERFVNFLKILPKNKFKIIEEIPCSKDLERELKKRRKEIADGKVFTHTEFYKNADYNLSTFG